MAPQNIEKVLLLIRTDIHPVLHTVSLYRQGASPRAEHCVYSTVRWIQWTQKPSDVNMTLLYPWCYAHTRPVRTHLWAYVHIPRPNSIEKLPMRLTRESPRRERTAKSRVTSTLSWAVGLNKFISRRKQNMSTQWKRWTKETIDINIPIQSIEPHC